MSDSTNTNEAITEVVPKVLAKYLKTNIKGIAETYDEFPASTQKLAMPCISVFASSNAEFKAGMPYETEIDPEPDISDESTQRTRYVVGTYDFALQLDLWARNKEERDDLFDSLFNALNPDISPMGLVLEMPEYFDQLCDFLYVGHNYEDSDIRAQRDEWRVTCKLLVTCKAIRERTEFVMETFETVDTINETVVVEDDED